ncbi:MAG: hypothetical protein PHC43_00905 [Candidatus Marinimicrobia bacterium]|nr:hypothetical protein [Candidatus Neomarinimicrobiota bacterium]MDD5540761.1 hypothetical protein [Candidatus Neomarinimicrobiota bacterium]
MSLTFSNINSRAIADIRGLTQKNEVLRALNRVIGDINLKWDGQLRTETLKKEYLGNITFEDDFEEGNLDLWDTPGSDWSVQGSVVKSGSYSALCDVTAWESENAKLELTGTWKNFAIEGDIRVNQKYGVCQKATVGGRSDTTSYIYYALSMRPGDDGHFQYYDGDYHNFPNDKTWAVNTWYHFRIEFDFANSIQRTWVDDDYLGSRPLTDGHGVLLDDNRYFETIAIMGSSGWESGHDYLYLDNVEVTLLDNHDGFSWDEENHTLILSGNVKKIIALYHNDVELEYRPLEYTRDSDNASEYIYTMLNRNSIYIPSGLMSNDDDYITLKYLKYIPKLTSANSGTQIDAPDELEELLIAGTMSYLLARPQYKDPDLFKVNQDAYLQGLADLNNVEAKRYPTTRHSLDYIY